MEKFEAFSPESWSYAGQMTLLGMVMIFAVLGLLWMILTVFKLVFVGRSKPQEDEPEQSSHQTRAEAPQKRRTAPKAPVIATNGDDEVTAAIITAAIAAYMAEQGVSEDGFRVVSFKRVQGGRAWNSK